jgi:hypothetical protein
MSFYNMLHGINPMADQLLACLGLTRGDVGRFRDAYVSEGKIAIYTRNGGGNRECWCADDPRYGYSDCIGHDWKQEEDERVYMTEAEIATNPQVTPLNSYIVAADGTKRLVGTGKRIVETYRHCENPCSADCACPGCTIEYRLPLHPNYLYDEDDEFDSTYATIYFSFPEQYKEWLELCESGKWDPDKKWLDFFKHLETDGTSEAERTAFKPIADAIEKLLSDN